MPDKIIRCLDCEKEFVFSTGEQAFYRLKKLSEPHRCQSCRNRGRQSTILRTISSEWKRDAIKEKSKYFYDDGDVLQLTKGEKYFVIGRKGAGKTAVADYIDSIDTPNIFSTKISFKNFPFNELYEYINSSYTAPNQYISIWKYVIYSSICQLMAKDQSIKPEIAGSLHQLYGTTTERRLNKLISQWTATSFNIDILGCGGGGERAKKDPISWIEKTEILESVIRDCIDTSSYFVLIDELDENYTVFPSEEDKKRYFDLITSLFKAVQDIKNTFDESPNILPIVFLREDIFNLIIDPDKNKWHDYIINLEWDVAKIRNMIKHRISVVTKRRYKTFEDAWNTVFLDDEISVGKRQEKTIGGFEYISRLAQLRPRDYIEYIRECAELALRRGEPKITGQIIKFNNKNFSSYLLAEIRDEAHSALPEFDAVIKILPIIRKQIFSVQEFNETYMGEFEKGNLQVTGNSEKALEYLFEYGVIGNYPRNKGKAIFRFEYPSATINHREMLIVHRGLYGALQIF